MASMIQEPQVAFSGSFISDPAGGVLKLVAYIVVALVFVYSRNYLEEHNLFKGEFSIETDPEDAWVKKMTYRYEAPAQAEQDIADWADLDIIVLRLKPKVVVKVM